MKSLKRIFIVPCLGILFAMSSGFTSPELSKIENEDLYLHCWETHTVISDPQGFDYVYTETHCVELNIGVGGVDVIPQ